MREKKIRSRFASIEKLMSVFITINRQKKWIILVRSSIVIDFFFRSYNFPGSNSLALLAFSNIIRGQFPNASAYVSVNIYEKRNRLWNRVLRHEIISDIRGHRPKTSDRFMWFENSFVRFYFDVDNDITWSYGYEPTVYIFFLYTCRLHRKRGFVSPHSYNSTPRSSFSSPFHTRYASSRP